MGDTSVSYSLKYNSRCIVAQPADTVNSKWLVGTNALREENEVRQAASFLLVFKASASYKHTVGIIAAMYYACFYSMSFR